MFDDMALGEFLVREQLLTRDEATRGFEDQARCLRLGLHVPGLLQALSDGGNVDPGRLADIHEALERQTLLCENCGEANVILSRRRQRVCRCGERLALPGGVGEDGDEDSDPFPGEGESFGPFELGARLGHGAYGVVYRARDTRTGGEVALKILRREADTERLDREVDAVRRLKHPLLVPIREHGRVGGWEYLAMECIEGPSLSALLRGDEDGGLPRIVQMLAQVARAVHEAHRSGIVHRDLKPANILIDLQGRPRLVDFGLSLDFSGGQCDETGGTPAFMAPEQVRAKDLGPAVDLWALGVILYRAAAGRLPFRGKRLVEVYFRILKDEPRYRDLPADPGLRAVIARCLNKRPEGRYPTALALARDLERWSAGKPVKAGAKSRGLSSWLQVLLLLAAASIFGGSLQYAAARRAERREAAQLAAFQAYPSEVRLQLQAVRGELALGRSGEAFKQLADLQARHAAVMLRLEQQGREADTLAVLEGEFALLQGWLHGSDLGQARGAFRRAQRWLPDDPRPGLGMARALMTLGRDADAMSLVQQSLARWPDCAQARLLRGELHWFGAELDAARSDFFSVAYADSVALEMRAQAYGSVARLEGALGQEGLLVSALESAARLETPRRAWYLAELGRALRLFGLMPGDARRPLEQAVQLGLQTAVPYRELALLAYSQGDVQTASEQAEQALALDPFDPPALVLRGRLRESFGQVEAGVADYKAALQSERDGAGPGGDLFLRARHARDLERLTLLGWLLQLCPEHVSGRVAQAELLRVRNQLDDAARLGTEAFEQNPMAHAAYAAVGKVFLQRGGAENLVRAEFLLDLAVERGDEQIETFLARARTNESLGYTAKALADYTYVVKMNPWNSEALAGQQRTAEP